MHFYFIGVTTYVFIEKYGKLSVTPFIWSSDVESGQVGLKTICPRHQDSKNSNQDHLPYTLKEVDPY